MPETVWCVKIPVGHPDCFERELHFVISFLKFLVQLVKFGDILPESCESYDISLFVPLERNADDIIVLP